MEQNALGQRVGLSGHLDAKLDVHIGRVLFGEVGWSCGNSTVEPGGRKSVHSVVSNSKCGCLLTQAKMSSWNGAAK